MAIRVFTACARRSIWNTDDARPLVAQTARAPTATSSSGSPTSSAFRTRPLSGSMRSRRVDPSVTQRAPAPAKTLRLLRRRFVTGWGGARGSVMRRVATAYVGSIFSNRRRFPSRTHTASPSAASALGVASGATTCVTACLSAEIAEIVRLASLATQTNRPPAATSEGPPGMRTSPMIVFAFGSTAASESGATEGEPEVAPLPPRVNATAAAAMPARRISAPAASIRRRRGRALGRGVSGSGGSSASGTISITRTGFSRPFILARRRSTKRTPSSAPDRLVTVSLARISPAVATLHRRAARFNGPPR